MPFVKNWRNEYNFSLDVNGKSVEERKGGWMDTISTSMGRQMLILVWWVGFCGMQQVTHEAWII